MCPSLLAGSYICLFVNKITGKNTRRVRTKLRRMWFESGKNQFDLDPDQRVDTRRFLFFNIVSWDIIQHFHLISSRNIHRS